MGDFLSNLAAKSLSIAPVVLPRPVSLFEPWQAGGVLGLSYRIDNALHETPSVFDHTPPGPSTVMHNVDLVAQPRPDPPLEADAAHRGRQVIDPLAQLRLDPPSQAQRDHSSDVRHALTIPQQPALEPMSHRSPSRLQPELAPLPVPSKPMDRERDVAYENVSQSPVGQSSTTRTNDTTTELRSKSGVSPVIERVIVERERVEHEAQPLATKAAASPTCAPAASEVNAAPRPIVTPVIERLEGVREQPDRDRPWQSGQALSVRQSLVSQQRNTAYHQTSTQPTIHVTIGRIEVRATPAATPVKHAPRSTPTMSLEEYLQSRSGNQR